MYFITLLSTSPTRTSFRPQGNGLVRRGEQGCGSRENPRPLESAGRSWRSSEGRRLFCEIAKRWTEPLTNYPKTLHLIRTTTTTTGLRVRGQPEHPSLHTPNETIP